MDTQSDQESLYPFPEDIIIQDRISAAQYARIIFEQGPTDRVLVVWVDASVTPYPRTRKASRLAAAAVRYLDFSSKSWKELVTLTTLPYGSSFSSEAELIAIYEAFRVACRLMDNFDRLLILSDCQSILEGLGVRSPFRYLSNPGWITSLFTCANRLYDVGITVELRWVPGHCVEGNERVDELAKHVRRSAESILAKEQPNAVIHQVTFDPSAPRSLRQVLLAELSRIKKTKAAERLWNLRFSYEAPRVNLLRKLTKGRKRRQKRHQQVGPKTTHGH